MGPAAAAVSVLLLQLIKGSASRPAGPGFISIYTRLVVGFWRLGSRDGDWKFWVDDIKVLGCAVSACGHWFGGLWYVLLERVPTSR